MFSDDLLNCKEFQEFYKLKKEQLPVRAKNILGYAEHSSYNFNSDLRLFLTNEFPYKSYRNAGLKTKNDLEVFFQNLKVYLLALKSEKDLEGPPKNPNSICEDEHFTSGKEELFFEFFNQERGQLSRRATNVLGLLLKNSAKGLAGIKEHFQKNLDFYNSLNNSGTKTAIELHGFFMSLESKYKELLKGAEVKKEDLFLLKIKSLTNGRFSLQPSSEADNPFLWFYDFLDASLGMRNANIARLYFKDGLSLKEIAEKTFLTFERIRQILIRIRSTILDCFKLVIDQFEIDLLIFNEFTQDYYSFSSEEFSSIINKSELAPFSKRFLKEIGPLIFEHYGFVLIPGKTKFFSGCKPGTYRYEECIKKRLISKFWVIKSNVITLKTLKNVGTKILFESCSRLDNDKYVTWDKFKVQSSEQLELLSHFLSEEIGVYSNQAGVYFTRNTPMTMAELVYIALEELDQMSTLKELIDQLKILFPIRSARFKNDSVRSVIARNKHLFIYERRQTSLYGLKIWEEEKGFKGGTIKDMAAEYLTNLGRPCHIQELAGHIIKYRKNTNVNSVRYNLYQDTSRSFVFYRNGKVGLKQKEELKKSFKENDMDDFIDGLFDY